MSTSNLPRITISRNARSDTNVSTIYFVMNSNIPVKNMTEGQVTDIRDELDDYIMNNLLTNGTTMGEIFGHAPLVKSISVDRFDWEVGTIMKRLHANLIVTIHHHMGNYSVNKANKRLQDWLNEQDTRSNGWYVHSRLNDRKAENYANKERRADRNRQYEEREDLADELERLTLIDS